jgi:hypothetical protein
MVQAKIAKRKTQTRRLQGLEFINESYSEWHYEGIDDIGHIMVNDLGIRHAVKCPYGQPGDILWTRESWQLHGWNYENGEATIKYKTGEVITHEYAEDSDEWLLKQTDSLIDAGILKPADEEGDENMRLDLTEKPQPWRPSIFLPKWACRFFDEVVEIRIERVADISSGDAADEGIESWNEDYQTEPGAVYADYANYLWKDNPKHSEYNWPSFANPISSYRSLWQLINGQPTPIQKKENGKLVTVGYELYPFDEEGAIPYIRTFGKNFGTSYKEKWRGKPLKVVVNPWVWVIKFKPTERPENW